MSSKQREALRVKFGGRCAYCGIELVGKWHADHAEPIRRNGSFVGKKWVCDGTMRNPENHRQDNLYPSCVRCNILKSAADIEEFRSNLTYFAHSIPRIGTYSHVHHLMRFGKLTIDLEPVVFWFEKYKTNGY